MVPIGLCPEVLRHREVKLTHVLKTVKKLYELKTEVRGSFGKIRFSFIRHYHREGDRVGSTLLRSTETIQPTQASFQCVSGNQSPFHLSFPGVKTLIFLSLLKYKRRELPSTLKILSRIFGFVCFLRTGSIHISNRIPYGNNEMYTVGFKDNSGVQL